MSGYTYPLHQAPSDWVIKENQPLGWNQFLKALNAHRIPPHHRPWMARHIKALSLFMHRKPLRALAREDIERFFAETSFKHRWQEQQARQAVLILYQDVLGRDDIGGATQSITPDNTNSASYTPWLEEASQRIQFKGLSPQTERTYLHWIRRFLAFSSPEKKEELCHTHLESWLTYLAAERKVAPATQQQALNALIFYYRNVLNQAEMVLHFRNSQPRKKLPSVLSRKEVTRLLGCTESLTGLILGLLYGTGMRIGECLSLRIKDIDLDEGIITIREGKGSKDRLLPLPESYRDNLTAQIKAVKIQHEKDIDAGLGETTLPHALSRKYPYAARQAGWQYLFPSSRYCTDEKTGKTYRHHLYPTTVQRALKQAVKQADIHKHVTCHTLRHSFATHLLQQGYDIRSIQQLMGHDSVETTMIYTHILTDREKPAVKSPVDTLALEPGV